MDAKSEDTQIKSKLVPALNLPGSNKDKPSKPAKAATQSTAQHPLSGSSDTQSTKKLRPVVPVKDRIP